MKWIEHLYLAWLAKNNCEKSDNRIWYIKHSNRMQKLMDMLPHGSGFDGTYSLEVSEEKIKIYMQYHPMNENGFYCSWLDFAVTLKPSFFYGYNMTITGRFGRDQALKDYIYDTYDELLSRDIEPVYIICDKTYPELMWSNEVGWVKKIKDATTFSDNEMRELRLPINGEWELLRYE